MGLARRWKPTALMIIISAEGKRGVHLPGYRGASDEHISRLEAADC